MNAPNRNSPPSSSRRWFNNILAGCFAAIPIIGIAAGLIGGAAGLWNWRRCLSETIEWVTRHSLHP